MPSMDIGTEHFYINTMTPYARWFCFVNGNTNLACQASLRQYSQKGLRKCSVVAHIFVRVQIYRPCMESQTSEINFESESWHMYLVSLGNTKCMIWWAVPTLSGKCQFIVQCLPHHCEFWLVLIFECVKYFAWSLLWWFCDFSVIQFVNKLVQLKAPTWCWRSTCQKQYFNRFIIRESFNYKCIKTYWCEWAE